MSPFHLAQLRHLYKHMVSGTIDDLVNAAEGLLAPAIRDEEREQRERAALDEKEWSGDRCPCPNGSCHRLSERI